MFFLPFRLKATRWFFKILLFPVVAVWKLGRSVWRTFHRPKPALNPLTLGGVARLEAVRPEKISWWTVGGGFLGLGLLMLLAIGLLNMFFGDRATPLYLTAAAAIIVYLGIVSVARQRRIAPAILSQSLRSSLISINPASICAMLLGLALFTALIAAAAVPSGQMFGFFTGSTHWLIIGTLITGSLAAWKVTSAASGAQDHELKRMDFWGNEKDGVLKAATGRAINSPEIHRAVSFLGDRLRIYPVPHDIAAGFSEMQLKLTRGYKDDVMLLPESTADDIWFGAITEEELEIRRTLRASDYKLLGFDDREVEDQEILGRELPIDSSRVTASHLRPPKPRPARAALGVSAKNFEQIQRFAIDAGKTIVGADLNRWNDKKYTHENLIYVQDVSREEREILQQVSSLFLGGNTWEMWMEFYWLPTDDAESSTKRLDIVIIKRSPISGLTPDARREKWRAVISMLPNGNNGWEIVDDPESELVILCYGEELELPEEVLVLDMIPEVFDEMAWSKIPIGIGVNGKPLTLDLSLVPHTLIAGKPGSGKSTLLRTDMAQRIARGHKLMVFDPFKKAPWATMFRPYTIAWNMETRNVANALAFAYEESKRRGKVIREAGYENWYDFPVEEREAHGLYPLSIYFDEYESAIEPRVLKTTELAFGKDSDRYLSDQKYNAAVGLVQHYIAQIGIESRFAGLYLVVATQFPYKEKLGAARNVLGNTIQLHGVNAVIQSSEVQLAMGADTSQTVELLAEFGQSRPGKKPPQGLGVIRDSDNGTLSAMKVAFLEPEGVVPLLDSLNIRPCQPWRVTDELGVGVQREEAPEARSTVTPPSTVLSHLKEDELVKDDPDDSDDYSFTD